MKGSVQPTLKWIDTVDKNSTLYEIYDFLKAFNIQTFSGLFNCYCGKCGVSDGGQVYLFGGCIRDYILGIEPNDFDIGFTGSGGRNCIRSILQKFEQDPQLELKSSFNISDIENDKYLCFSCGITLPKSKKRVKIDLVVRDEILLSPDFSVNTLQIEMNGSNSGDISVFSTTRFSSNEIIRHIKKKELHFLFNRSVCDICDVSDNNMNFDDDENPFQRVTKYSKQYLISNGKFLERLNKMLSKGFTPLKTYDYTKKNCDICKQNRPIILQSKCNHTFCIECVTKYYEIEAQKKLIKNNEQLISTKLEELNKTIVERIKNGEDYATVTSVYWDKEYARIIDAHNKKQTNIAFCNVSCPCCSCGLSLHTRVHV